MECVRLRVKDVDFARREIVVRDGKGGKDRVTMLSASLRVFAGAFAGGQGTARRRPGHRLRRGLDAGCPGGEVSQRGEEVGPAVCVSGGRLCGGPAFGYRAPASSRQEARAAGDVAGGAAGLSW